MNPDDDDNYGYHPSEQPLLAHAGQQAQIKHKEWRQRAREFLGSKTKHYIILGMVVLDVACILADIFVSLIACDLGKEDEEWVERTGDILYVVGVVFNSLFLVELLVTVWAFGARYVHVFLLRSPIGCLIWVWSEATGHTPHVFQFMGCYTL